MTLSRLQSPAFQSQWKSASSTQPFRILFLVPFAPHLQANHGGSRVIAQLIAHLAQRHSIGLCYLRAAGEAGVDGVLRERCDVVEEVLIPEFRGSRIKRWFGRLRGWKELVSGKPLWAIDRFSPNYEERVRRLLKTWRPDLVQIEFHVMGQYLSALAGYPAPRILVQHEPGEDSARELIRSPFVQGRIIPQLDLLAWKRFEREIVRQVQTVVVFTERDRETVSKLGQQTPIVQIPLGTEIPEVLSQVENEPLSLLFVGNFKHLPNVDAADRLINGIFPQVQSRFPGARLFIVGDHLPSHIMRTPNENVILTGYVPDVKPYLDKTTLVIVPLRLGGGMRVKVLEALAAGKPLVASSRAVEGLGLVNGEQVILAEEDEEFTHAIGYLLGNLDKRAFIAAQARAWASANLSWEKTVLAYEDLYHHLLRDDYITR
jgi:polysaccharide biosynthesis protein PslH